MDGWPLPNVLSTCYAVDKYADDTNLLVPADSDVDLVEEFN